MIYKFLLTLITSLLFQLIISCAPASNNTDGPKNEFNKYTSGKTITIQPSDTSKPKKEVAYVNSGDTTLLKKIKEKSLENSDNQASEENKYSLQLRNNIKAVELLQTADNKKMRLIVTINNHGKAVYHTFDGNTSEFTNISGTSSLNKEKVNPKSPSHLTADLECLETEACRRAHITLTLKGSTLINNKSRDYDITAHIGYTRNGARIQLRNQSTKGEVSQLAQIINERNSSETDSFMKVDVIVADGVSYSQVKSDKLNITVPVTDSRTTDAMFRASQAYVHGAKVHSLVFQGVSLKTGSILIDVKSSNINSSNERQNFNDRLVIYSQEDAVFIAKGQITKNFNIKNVKREIYNNEATWEHVGVNPRTSLFFKDITDPQLLRKILIEEAEFESLRSDPDVIKIVDDYKNEVCNTFIKNLAPAREILAEAYLNSQVSPNFATIMRLESLYGIGSRRQGIETYDMAVNLGPATASGPFQINYHTYFDILKRGNNPNSTSGYVGELIQNGYNFTHIKSKIDFDPEKNNTHKRYFPNKDYTSIEPQLYQLDHRMFLESAAILSSSLMAYNRSLNRQDAPLSYATYKQGASRYNNEPRFQGLSLIEIKHFNMAAVGVKDEKTLKYQDGINYALKAIAIRSILTQPENYCDGTREEDFINLYQTAKASLKNKKVQEKMNLFHPSGPILNYSK